MSGIRWGRARRDVLVGAAVVACTFVAACAAPATTLAGAQTTAASPPTSTSPSASPSPSPSAVGERAPAGFVSLSDIDPTILLDIRYDTDHNLPGRPITG